MKPTIQHVFNWSFHTPTEFSIYGIPYTFRVPHIGHQIQGITYRASHTGHLIQGITYRASHTGPHIQGITYRASHTGQHIQGISYRASHTGQEVLSRHRWPATYIIVVTYVHVLCCQSTAIRPPLTEYLIDFDKLLASNRWDCQGMPKQTYLAYQRYQRY